MEYQIQSIVFPTETKHQQCRELFYRGDRALLDREARTLTMGLGQTCDFVTYLNGCSYRKWREYTRAGRLFLYLELSGDARLCFLGYHKDLATVVRTEFQMQEVHTEEREIIRYQFPENTEQIAGFEISSAGACTLYGGYFAVECQKEDLNDITLCLATTTCRKEAFIKKNVALLKKEILDEGGEMAEHFFIHVVDNGRTLEKADICGEHIALHPNSNAGGSGGFARGMIESMNQTPKATHVLLMDDDVLILPESLKRTYHLLRFMRAEHRDDFISGAMLYYEEPERQHEDIGTVTEQCMFFPLKPKFDQRRIESNLDNEAKFLKQKNEYAGWWYCCIPTQVIRKNGLPLPLFIRCDDMEYSLRCRANILTMNSICLWHMGFVTKYNAAFDRYQQCRNLLVGKACTGILKNVDVWDFVYKSYRSEILRFNYDAAELVLRAIEDFLKGPDFFKIDRGEAIVKENSKFNARLAPLEELEGTDRPDIMECYQDPPRKFLDKWLMRLSFNGQRQLWPSFIGKKGMVPIAFDHTYQPQKIAMRKSLLAVNPFSQTGEVRTLDKGRYRELQKRYRQLHFYYRSHSRELEKTYKENKKLLTSEKFWRKYLKLQDSQKE